MKALSFLEFAKGMETMEDISMTTQEPETLYWLASSYKTILSPEVTGGSMSIVDSVTEAGGGPPRHIHHAEDETFVVLSGRVRFWVDGDVFERGAGETVFVPRGTEHTFVIVGDEPSRHLVILTPGGFEGFFADMASNGYAIPGDMDAIVASGRAHNLTFTGPPLDPTA